MNENLTNNEWRKFLENEFEEDYFKKLDLFVSEEYQTKTIFPDKELIFNAFNTTDLSNTKVIILGQDPYHSYEETDGNKIPHAHGLSFSIPQNAKKTPPSLRNIFKELNQDLGHPPPKNGDLTHWAAQGVLLLNATLTVEAHKAGSHQKKGWETFTDKVIKKLSENKTNLIFLLWGKFAEQKECLIDTNKHFIIKAAHPSPFSAHRGFYGCKHFSKTNSLLKEMGKEVIDWEIK